MMLAEYLHSRNFFDCNRIHISPNIPLKKINNALDTFKLNFPAEDIVVMLDNTMMGSGKDGVLICRQGIVVRDAFDDPRFYPFSALNSIAVEGTKLYLNHKKVISFSMPDKKDVQRLFSLLSDWHLRPEISAQENSSAPVEEAKEQQNQPLVEALQHYLKNRDIKDVYSAPAIPLKKLNAAVDAYGGQHVRAEDVMVLVDDTAFGGAKEGMLITEHFIAIKVMMESAFLFSLRDIKHIAIEKRVLYINKRKICQFTLVTEKELGGIFKLINDGLSDGNTAAEIMSLPAPFRDTPDEEVWIEPVDEITLTPQNDAKKNISSYVFSAIDKNKDKILPLLKSKGGALSQAALEDDRNVEKVANLIYAFLPGFVRFAVKEQIVINFLLTHRDKLVVALFPARQGAEANIVPQSSLSINEQLDALFQDDDAPKHGMAPVRGVTPHEALRLAMQELVNECRGDPDLTLLVGHSLKMAAAVLDHLERSHKAHIEAGGEEVIFALVIMQAFSYHKLPAFMIEDDEENTLATLYIMGMMMIMENYAKYLGEYTDPDEAMTLSFALMKCASKDQLNQMIRNIIDGGTTFTSSTIFTPEDMLLLLRKANQSAEAWSEKLVAAWLQDELAIQRKWGDLFVR